MIRRLVICTLLAAVAGTLAGGGGQGAARDETVLFWDSGETVGYTGALWGRPGAGAAVLFIAPHEAVAVTEIRLHTEHDSCDYPAGWPHPAPREFRACVWKPSFGIPVTPWEPVGMCVWSGEEYAEEAWVSLPLPEPVPIENEQHFPNRSFFAVIEWEYACSPFVSGDSDGPNAGMSLQRWYSSFAWEPHSQDLMIRAVVTDSLGTPVELGSWGVIKSRFGR